jgi:ankyrin repeat protein
VSPDDPDQPPVKIARSQPVSAEELCKACDRGDLPLVRRLLKKAKPGDGIFEDEGRMSLIAASRNGHAEIVDALIKAGAPLNHIPSGYRYDDVSALTAACMKGHLQIVKNLLDAGADANIETGRAFIEACEEDDIEMVKLLLSCGADIDIRDGLGLRWACMNGHSQIVELLLERGAKINGKGRVHPLPCACYGGSLAVATMLLDKGADIRAVDVEYGTALHAACRGNHEDLVKKLLNRGADVHQLDNSGGSALHVAAICSAVEIMQMLIDKGADVNAADKAGDTPLIDSCRSSDTPFAKVKLLLESGAFVDACGSGGTALTVACRRGLEDVVKLLLEWNADVTIEGGWNGTALQAACDGKHYDLVPLLLERGANPYSEGGKCGSAIQIAEKHNRPEIVDLFRLSKHAPPVHANSHDSLPSFYDTFTHPVDQSSLYPPSVPLPFDFRIHDGFT